MPDPENDKTLRFIEKYLGVVGRTISWLWLLIVAVVLSNLVGAFLFDYLGQGIAAGIVWITIGVLGFVIGVIWAEYVRRKIGFLNLFTKLNSSSDYDDAQAQQKKANRP